MDESSGRPMAAGGTAWRRQQRSMLRHERQTVAMALAECQHHSAQRQTTARAGTWVRGARHGPTSPGAPEPQTENQLVAVPPIVSQQPRIISQSFVAGADGHRSRGQRGLYWWRTGTSHTQWTPPLLPPLPEGTTASPGRYTNTGQPWPS